MNNKKIKPLIFAIATALSPTLAQAAVTATQLPGDGSVYSGFGSASATVSGASMSVNIISATSDGNAGNVALFGVDDAAATDDRVEVAGRQVVRVFPDADLVVHQDQ